MKRNRLVVLITVLVVLVSATAAFAAVGTTTNFTGTVNGSEPNNQDSYGCGPVPQQYVAFNVVPNATGNYSYTDLSIMYSIDMTLTIYYPSYDPANVAANRIANFDDGGTVALTAGNTYTFVVQGLCNTFADYVGWGANTWEFEMTGPDTLNGSGAPTAGSNAPWNPGDARLNRQPAQPAAAYCEADGLHAYGPTGEPLLYASWEAINAAGVPANGLTALDTNEAMGAGFFRLADGWFQLVVDNGAETYTFRWDGCPMTHSVTEVFSAAGDLLVYEEN